MDKGIVKRTTLQEFRQEQKKSSIRKIKEDDEDEYDTYEMFHIYLAGVGIERGNKHSVFERQPHQNFKCDGEDNPFE